MNTGNYVMVVFLDFILTGIFYEIIPLVARFCFKDKYTKREAIKIAVANSALVYGIFTMIHFLVLRDGVLANINAAWIWGTVAYMIVPKCNTKEIKKEILKNIEDNK